MIYKSKLDWIGPYVEGKDVLDLGCVCHDLEQTAVPWLHGFIRDRANRVLGVDYLDSEVQKMRDRGFDVVCANVEKMDIGEQFDVIVAGDIIEHLNNFDAFFNRVKAHLLPGGVFIVTTPNPVTYLRFLRVLVKGSAGANKEHTCWFTAKVLRQLAARFGLEAVDEIYVDDGGLFYPWLKPVKKGSAMRRFFRHAGRLASMLFIWKPAVLANSLICLVRPKMAETFGLAFKVKEG